MYFLSKWIEHVYIIYVCSIITHIINVFSVKMNNTCLYNLYYLIEENEKQDIPHRWNSSKMKLKNCRGKIPITGNNTNQITIRID
jgi:hypothetical protein